MTQYPTSPTPGQSSQTSTATQTETATETEHEMATQPILIVYTDDSGATHSEYALTATSALTRIEELEAHGYRVD